MTRAVRAVRRIPGTSLAWGVAMILSTIAFGTAGTAYDVDVLGWGLMPFIGALVGLPFGLVTTRPMLGWVVSAGSALVLTMLLPLHRTTAWPWLVVHGLVILALLFGVGVRARRRDVVLTWLGTSLLFASGVKQEQSTGWVVGVTAVALAGALAGRLAVTTVALDRQTRMSQDEKARRLVLEERTRIARDLHDIVAHHMSLIVVQAETAAYRRPDLTPAAREELGAISTAAREALSQTRALLSVLRREDEPADLAPQPGLEQLDELCRSAIRAGVPVTNGATVSANGVRRASSLAAYRIVQESLANAARHAPGAAVRVEITWEDTDLVVSVGNGPPSPPRAPDAVPGPPGHGIVGMREHAVAEGGTLTTGPTPDGGFAVRAVLPAARRPDGGGRVAGEPAKASGTGGTDEVTE